MIAYNHTSGCRSPRPRMGGINIAAMTNLTAPSLVREQRGPPREGLFRMGEPDERLRFGLYGDHSTSHVSWAQNTVTDRQAPDAAQRVDSSIGSSTTCSRIPGNSGSRIRSA